MRIYGLELLVEGELERDGIDELRDCPVTFVTQGFAQPASRRNSRTSQRPGEWDIRRQRLANKRCSTGTYEA